MVNEANMAPAITECNSFEVLNYERIAPKYKLVPSTPRRRHQGHTISYTEARSKSHKRLTNAQEALSIKYINKLADRAILLTPRIIGNLVIELIKAPVGVTAMLCTSGIEGNWALLTKTLR